MEHRLVAPLSKENVMKLRAGDIVYLDGTILTLRDEAHKRLLSSDGMNMPFGLDGATIFHCGPLMRKDAEWRPIAIGPTTSARMTKMTLEMLKRFDIRGIIGKGGMESIAGRIYEKCIYLASTGGCAAITSAQVKHVIDVHWLDLGMTEAVWVLEVEQFGPLIVGIDAHGNDLYAEVMKKADEQIKKMF
ncbi:MAG: FumA C-terminus/TtdB family hydratase beta subunit [Methanosarcinales archaeon Met12]|nr:MAG: FumA C-terminus/TtdB family hydratase beta subunit [Methanosarcinales archaeon Met12]